MGRQLTNNISLAYSIEATFGVLNPSGEWKLLEPNDISTFGATITTVPRAPISKTRQRRKGTVTDLDSAAEFEHDLTKEVFIDFAEGFVFATFQGTILAGRPTAVLAASYTVPSGPVLQAGTLVYGRNFANAANNGLKEVDTGALATSVPIVGGGLTAETPASEDNRTLEPAGFRFGTGEIDITVTGTTAVIARQSGTVDFQTLGLTPGQLIHIGGLTTGEQFSAGAGYARVISVPDATTINLDKLSSTLATDDGVGDTVDLLYGRFLKNVATDDASYVARSYQFEAGYDTLGAGDTPEYEYSLGNFANTMALQLPLADKALVTFGFVGTDTQPPSSTRATNADTPTQVVQDTAYNTSADILRLRIQQLDETGLTTCFKDVTLTLNNNAAPEKCLGTLGALFMNVGNFEVDLEGQILFTDSAVAQAVRDNETVTMDTLLKNDDGAIGIDIPEMTLGGGDKEFPVNESVLMNLTGQAFGDSQFNASIGISLFPVVP